jgi:hypothetical protein
MDLTIFAVLIAFLGFPFGILLAKISPEEMKKGKKYFKLIQSFIIALIIFIFLYQYLNIIISIIISVLFFLITIYLRVNHKIFYILFVFLLYLSNKTNIAFLCSLIFLFGIVSGSIFPKIKRNKFQTKTKEVIIENTRIFFLFIIYFILYII